MWGLVKKYPTLGELSVDPNTPYFNWLVPFAPMLRRETFDQVGTDIETKSKRTIAAKQNSTPGMGYRDMITEDVEVRRE